MVKQLPISFKSARKVDVRTQFGALCYRIVKGKLEFLLVTSRRSGRWIVPKGWPMDGKTPFEAAAQEAWEEAGATGKIGKRSLGIYSYHKCIESENLRFPCIVMLFPLKVKKLAADFPEKDQRRRIWLSAKKAAARITEPELARIVRDFDPKKHH